MIKFFRRIRYDQMKKNKTGKYFKYAIGEIVLVVIGILIALQINNWNEVRKTENMGKVYIGEIYTELKNEVTNLNGVLLGLQIQYDGTESVLSFFESDDKVIKDTIQFTNNHWAPSKIFIIQRNKNTYDELSGSGQIGLLKNDFLSILLDRFYDNLDMRITNFKEYPLQMRMELRKLTFPIGSVKDAKYDFVEDKLTKAFIQEYLSNEKVYETLLAIFKTCRFNIKFFKTSLLEAENLIKHMEINYPELKK